MQTPAPFCTCSRCGSEAVQKVSAIVHAGTWTGTSSSLAVGNHGGMAVGGGISTGATSLAALLVPPAKPQTGSLWPFLLGLPVFAIPVLLAAWGIQSMSSDTSYHAPLAYQQCQGVIVIFGALLLFGLWSLIKVNRNNENAMALLPAWEHQMRLWNQLFYCGRCDSVFNPSTAQNAPIGHMAQLLG